jgi:hypothetical protein
VLYIGRILWYLYHWRDQVEIHIQNKSKENRQCSCEPYAVGELCRSLNFLSVFPRGLIPSPQQRRLLQRSAPGQLFRAVFDITSTSASRLRHPFNPGMQRVTTISAIHALSAEPGETIVESLPMRSWLVNARPPNLLQSGTNPQSKSNPVSQHVQCARVRYVFACIPFLPVPPICGRLCHPRQIRI